MTPIQLCVLDAIRSYIDRTTMAPTLGEIVSATGMSKTGVHRAISLLVKDGNLIRKGWKPRGLALPAAVDLTALPTDRLRSELARRGETMDALATPRVLPGEGRKCAATACMELVGPGKLMCGRHWFRVERNLRDNIHASFHARDLTSYRDLVADAIDQADRFGGVAIDRKAS